ncbi:MAG: carboxypeptidase regulatory-like domain-containing protein [Candidatus Electrothrix sp. MAN1_4]|nr:carboxypeptidase regulatory-like domain-containing protein [Candidatus Electrothrix sp. MAN1_4]
MVISTNAFAQYQSDIEATDHGGGTWGEILRMKVRLQGASALFNVTSKKGAFYNTNSVTIRSGSHNGPVIVAGKIPSGSEAAKMQLDLDALPSFPHRFFATITNNVGYAWVGPIQISKNATAITEPVPWDNSPPTSGPQRPIINESPEKIAMNTIVNIAVSAGQTQSNEMVRVQCTASNSDNSPSNPYQSDWVYSGDTIRVPLTFYATGTQAIFCNTLDRFDQTSSLSQRTITVTPAQHFASSPSPAPTSPSVPGISFSGPTATPDFSASTPPPSVGANRRQITRTPPPIIKVSDQGLVNDPINIKLIAGHDPQNRDLVKITCTAEDSNKTTEKPYQSDWLPPEGKAEAQFIFYSPGEKSISCTSYGRQGVNSRSIRETLNIDYANQPPNVPVISKYPNTTYPGQTTYITVTAGSDPDGDQVRVKCSATDSSITGNTPYISEWMAPQATATASLAFFTAGNKEITCITIDSNNAQSGVATHNIHVHTSNYPPKYLPDHNLNNRSTPSNNASNAESCGCQQDNKSSSSPMQQNNQQNMSQGNMSQGNITFTQPYLPDLSNRQSMFEAPEPQPDLTGRVVYRSNHTPAPNALVKIFNAMSGKAYTATTDYNGEFKHNFAQGNFTGQIQATKGGNTSSIQEVQINTDNPTVIDLIIMDNTPVSQPVSQPQWPVQQAAPPINTRYNKQQSVWQFN